MASQNIVIVESPGKVQSITKYLNSSKNLSGKFTVIACFGHVRDLPKKELGIDINSNFEPKYEVLADKKKVIDKIKQAIKGASNIYLASDCDSEGEFISESLRVLLKLGNNYKRITFTEITQKALENAILNPGMIDNLKVHGQQCRRILDRLIGFKLSPVLWKVYKTEGSFTALSAGRVQSATLHIITEKEKEIEEFKYNNYWNFTGEFVLPDKQTLEDAKLYEGSTIHKIENKQKVVEFLSSIKGTFKIDDIKTKETKKNSDLPFITSTLQQEAYNKFGMSSKRTMSVTQELYEKGLITYMRTDSYNISDDFKVKTQDYITKTFGSKYLSDIPRKSTKSSSSSGGKKQEAHECIRPTNIINKGDTLGGDGKKLYELIWKRTCAYFMTPAVYDEIDIKILDNSFQRDMYFNSKFSKLKFNGWMIVYDVVADKYNFDEFIKKLENSKNSIICKGIFSKNIWSSPPGRYTEATIIKALEVEGIGRPSTYSSILSKLYDKKYIIKSDIGGVKKPCVHFKWTTTKKISSENGEVLVGAEKNKLVSTEVGRAIDDFLSKNFDYIVDKKFTASVEGSLDKIESGEKSTQDVLKLFWNTFGKDILKYEGAITRSNKISIKQENKVIKVDGVSYTLRLAKYGPVAESVHNDKKAYISLTSYMKFKKIGIDNIEENDIRLLKSMPMSLNINSQPFELNYGPYGFYGKYDGKNIKLFPSVAQSILDGTPNIEGIIKAIDFSKNKPDKK